MKTKDILKGIEEFSARGESSRDLFSRLTYLMNQHEELIHNKNYCYASVVRVEIDQIHKQLLARKRKP